jgi:hypothetical protein
MFSISEDITSCYIIIENENDFMGNLYDHGFFFDIIKENIYIYSNIMLVS